MTALEPFFIALACIVAFVTVLAIIVSSLDR